MLSDFSTNCAMTCFSDCLQYNHIRVVKREALKKATVYTMCMYMYDKNQKLICIDTLQAFIVPFKVGMFG